jgi:hypothetical protein
MKKKNSKIKKGRRKDMGTGLPIKRYVSFRPND